LKILFIILYQDGFVGWEKSSLIENLMAELEVMMKI